MCCQQHVASLETVKLFPPQRGVKGKSRLLLFKVFLDDRRDLQCYAKYEISWLLNLRDDDDDSATLRQRPKGHAPFLLLEKVGFLNTVESIFSSTDLFQHQWRNSRRKTITFHHVVMGLRDSPEQVMRKVKPSAKISHVSSWPGVVFTELTCVRPARWPTGEPHWRYAELLVWNNLKHKWDFLL